MKRFLLLAALALTVPVAAQEERVAAPAGARIAFQTATSEILIIGGDYEIGEGSANLPGLDRFPQGSNPDGTPGEPRKVTPAFLAGIGKKPRLETNWQLGQTWRIYPGAGAPASAVVNQLAYLEHPCIAGYDGAYARPAAADAARLAGLRARIFLAAPGAGLTGVSTQAMTPVVDPALTKRISLLMTERAQEFVRKDKLDPVIERGPIQGKQRIQRINQSVLEMKPDSAQMTLYRWKLPNRSALIFAEVLWVDRARGLTPFAATAVLAEVAGSANLKLLDFDPTYGDHMRMSEFSNWKWTLGSLQTFLNTWKIGERIFVLKRMSGYEGYSIGLYELSPTEGLIPTTLWIGSGC